MEVGDRRDMRSAVVADEVAGMGVAGRSLTPLGADEGGALAADDAAGELAATDAGAGAVSVTVTAGALKVVGDAGAVVPAVEVGAIAGALAKDVYKRQV